MKIFKKIILLVLIFVTFTTLNVYAKATEVTMNASVTEVEVGDIVTVSLLGECDAGIEGVDAVLDYDKTKLELTNENELAKDGYTSMSGMSEKTKKFQLSVLFTELENAPQQAEIVVLQFKVLKDVKANEKLNIKLSKIQLGNSNDEWTDLEDQTVTLKVKSGEPYAGSVNWTFVVIAGVIIVVVVLLHKKTTRKR